MARTTPHDIYTAGLRMTGRRVVLVGAARAALWLPPLLAAGARVVLVSPTAEPAVEELARDGRLTWLRRRYTPGDLADAWYAVAATGDPAADAAVEAEAEERRVWCARADDAPGVHHGDDAPGAPLPEPARPPGVALVGGGPGDPDLITVRGRRLLAEADVVVADRLAPRALLDGLPQHVEVIDASKIPYGPSMPQEAINTALIEHARAGKAVVRLKGGDPFVFGRGMEEVQALAEAGIACTVVPGVTSAIAVPSAAGIPVTHRGVAHEFTVVSGHLPPGDPRSLVDWPGLGRSRGTLVLLMAVEHCAAIAAALIAHGRSPDAPAAVVQDGTAPGQRRLDATLATLAATVTTAAVRPPAVIVVGQVLTVGARGA